MTTTGNAGGVHNLVVADTGAGYADLLAALDTGLVVTELMGSGVNPVTGDYSRGAAGFWVGAGGESQFPVNEVTIAGNLREMYRGHPRRRQRRRPARRHPHRLDPRPGDDDRRQLESRPWEGLQPRSRRG